MKRRERDKSAGELRIELRKIRKAVGNILDDYEDTARTLDAVTQEVSGIDATSHSDNVAQLRGDLLDALQSEEDRIARPWERAGYETRDEWIGDR